VTEGKYISDQQQRLLQVIRTLAGNEIEGLAPGDIAKLVPCAPSQVTRDLANLKHFGWAEQLATTGRWRLGPQIVQIATRHMTAIDRASKKLDEVANRYSRSSN
jgi:DNA-binding IclR family transcriptional regulator